VLLKTYRKILKSSNLACTHNVVSAGMNIAKIWLCLYFMGCVRFAWYCGKMYNYHLFSFRGLQTNFNLRILFLTVLGLEEQVVSLQLV